MAALLAVSATMLVLVAMLLLAFRSTRVHSVGVKWSFAKIFHFAIQINADPANK